MTRVAKDTELVERLRRGDRDALYRIYERYKDELLRLGGCMMANWMDAEDCLHDVFVSLAANSYRVRLDGNLKGYLVTAMANRSRDRLRRKKHDHHVGNIDDASWPAAIPKVADATATIIQSEADERLYLAVAALPAEQRVVITLRLHGEMTFDEIARHEGVSNNTIRSRYRYALDKLRSSLSVGVER
jgi:RNA polymerase sigma-70 factor (ECF subfamily)